MWKHLRNLAIIFGLLALIVGWFVTRPDQAEVALVATEGVAPELIDPDPQTIPTVRVAEVARWTAGEKPVAAPGLSVARFADGLDHPRSLYQLPNGAVLVAESNKPAKNADNGGITQWVMGKLMARAGAGVPSANRITLLRDGDGDGVAEERRLFLGGLNSPFGMAAAGDRFFVANTDGVWEYPFDAAAARITGKGRKLYALSSSPPNNHWTRNIALSLDGTKIYIAVGSNSNIGENGLDSEKGRAMVIEYDRATGKAIPYATGMRNPVGLAFHPGTGTLWATVNERDMLGSDLVPDYLAKVEFGADYGWPWHYWGGYIDDRVKPGRPEKRQYERRPDYALGAHVAALGVDFADGAKLGPRYANGAFVGRHGSWNRVPASGYDVVFVPFTAAGEPTGKPMPVLTGFLRDGKAKGRPVMPLVAADGSLLVTDDVGNTIWRVTAG